MSELCKQRWCAVLGEDTNELVRSLEIEDFPKRSRKRKAKRASDTPGLFAKLVALLGSINASPKRKNLRLCETITLGDKRFVAVVQFEGQRFLVGSSSNGISLLSSLPTASEPSVIPEAVAPKEFHVVLQKHMEGERRAV